jgi:branched-chain amino acid transport system substrate-binding protein
VPHAYLEDHRQLLQAAQDEVGAPLQGLGSYAQPEVGVIAPLSGNVATWGNDVKNALLFAKEKLAAENVTFVFEDDQCLGKNAVTAAHKLLDVDRIDFGTVVCTESLLSAAPIFEQSKVLVISPVASGAAVSNAGDYIFRIWPSDAEAGRLLFNYVQKKHRTFGVITEERGYAHELTEAYVSAARGSQMAVFSESFDSEDTDFRSLLLRLKARKAEGLFINTNSERTFAIVVGQTHELKWSPPTYGVYMPGNAAFLKLAGKTAEGIVYVAAPSVTSSLTPAGKELYSEFVARYGEMQSSDFVFASTFEVLRRLAALGSSSVDPRTQLYEGLFDGVFGPYSFDRNGDIVGVKHGLWKIENSTPTMITAGD